MGKASIDENGDSPPTSSKRLSRFLPNCKSNKQQIWDLIVLDSIIYQFSVFSSSLSVILYQEYSDVAINREIQRQQGAEPGTDEERGDSVSSGNLSPSSSFRSSRGSAFSLWQDIPDVRSSGQLDNFSNEERKLQEVTPCSEISQHILLRKKQFILS